MSDPSGVRAVAPIVGSQSASWWALRRLLDHSAAAIVVADLLARRGLFANLAAASLMGATSDQMQQLLDMELEEAAGRDAAARIAQSLAALSSGALRSYRGHRSYRDWNGAEIHAEHLVTRLDLCDAPPVAVALVSPRATTAATFDATPQHAPSLVTLDHHWRVDDASPDLEPRLGLPPAGLIGSDIFDLIHPDDREELLTVFDRASTGEPSSSLMCVRVGQEWRAADFVFAGLCRHRPQRLAALVTLHNTETITIDPSCPPEGQPVLAGVMLTVQQREVVRRLLRGESVSMMAQEMHLSRSTVRNHLSAVYAKAGVHSQAELVARITGRQTPGTRIG